MILFIDDEDRTDLYEDEMARLGLPVKTFRHVDEAWRAVSNGSQDVEMAIVDIMMPPGELFRLEDVDQGLRTGIEFFRLLRSVYPECVVFFLTNRSDSKVQREIAGEKHVAVRVKTDQFYDEFAAEMKSTYDSLRKRNA